MKLVILNLILFASVVVFSQTPTTYDKYQYIDRWNGTIEKVGGKTFPKFTATSLDGTTLSEESLKGKITLVNFWFEHCAPCIAELGELNKLYQRLNDKPGFQFISIIRESAESAERLVNKHQLQFSVYPLSTEECGRLNFGSGFPTNIILDREGKVIFYKAGGPIKEEGVKKAIQEIEERILAGLED
mgnify:CR=1 FL=1